MQITDSKNSYDYFNEETEDSIDIKGWILRIVRLWPWFLITSVIAYSCAKIYLRYKEPVYQSSAAIMIKDEKKGGGSVLDNPLLKQLSMGGGGNLMENEIEVLRSFDLLEEVVLKERLYISVKNRGRIATRTNYGAEQPFQVEIESPEMIDRPYMWVIDVGGDVWQLSTSDEAKPIAIEKGKWYIFKQIKFRIWPNIEYLPENKLFEIAKKPEYEIYINPVSSVSQLYKQSLSVVPVGKASTVIGLSITDLHYERATAVLKALIEIYTQKGLEDKNKVNSNTMDFLTERLRVVERELKGVEGDVESFKKKNQITEISAQAQVFLDMASEIDMQKAEQETKVNILNELEKELLLNQDNAKLVPSSLGIAELSLSPLIQRHNELVLQRDRIAERTGEKNPNLIDLENQIKTVRISLIENVKNLKGAYAIAMRDINAQNNRLAGRLSGIPSLEKNLIQISRDRNVKEQLYVFLLEKREEAAISLASSVADNRIVERARSNGQISPNPSRITLIALGLSLVLPLLLLIVRDFFDNKVGGRKQVETNCNAPLLGEISYIKKMAGPIEITPKSRSAVSEQIRGIRTGLSFTGKGENAKTILITSHRPGEGKSFTSVNLGASYALLNKKVVILEFDLRKPRLMRNLGLTAEIGISNYLTRKMDLDKLLVEVPGYQGNFWVMPTGPIPPNPAELILGQQMKQLMEELQARFDHIIIDSPPFSVVTDATLLQQYADLGVVILRQGHSEKDAYTDINNRLKQFPEFPIYTVLNGIGKTRKYSYYGSKYGEGYGYGYFEQEKLPLIKRIFGRKA